MTRQVFKVKKFIKRGISSVRAATDNRWVKAVMVSLLLGLISAKASAAVNPGSDILSGAQTDIAANFGAGSTFMYIMYVAEIILGAATYMKTKNLLSLVGLAVVLIFTSVGFGLVGP